VVLAIATFILLAHFLIFFLKNLGGLLLELGSKLACNLDKGLELFFAEVIMGGGIL